MGSQRLTAIADSGPIIHLAEISCLSILSIFEELHVPDAVWAETVESGRISEKDLQISSNLKRHTIPKADINNFIENYQLKELHSGECECLYLTR